MDLRQWATDLPVEDATARAALLTLNTAREMGQLDRILTEARAAGLKHLWLETGSTPAFDPAIRLYEKAGFRYCGPFASYKDDPFSRFMTLAL